LPALLLALHWVDDAERLITEEATFVFELLDDADNFLAIWGEKKR